MYVQSMYIELVQYVRRYVHVHTSIYTESKHLSLFVQTSSVPQPPRTAYEHSYLDVLSIYYKYIASQKLRLYQPRYAMIASYAKTTTQPIFFIRLVA